MQGWWYSSTLEGHGQGQQHLHDDPTTLAASCMRWVGEGVHSHTPGLCWAGRRTAKTNDGAGLTQILNRVPVRSTQLRADCIGYVVLSNYPIESYNTCIEY